MPCAAQPRVAPKEARAASRARSHGSKDKGRTKTCPSSTNHSSRVGDVLAHVRVTRVPQDKRTLDGLVLPFGPGEASGKCVRRACRTHGHSALTRSRWAAISGSSEPLATMGSTVPRQWQSPSQARGKLMPHWRIRGTLDRRMTWC